MDEASVAALRLAGRQHGVLRRDQAVGVGLSESQVRNRLRCGAFERVLPGVFRVEGAPRTWRQELKAGCLWAERGFAISHRSAAALWGFDRFKPGPLELSLLRHARPRAGWEFHWVNELSHRELASIDGLCVTNVTRTLLDLAMDESEATVRASVDQALSRKWTTLERLEVAVQRSSRRRGLGSLKALVHQYQGGDGPCESELEARVYELFDSEQLPRPVRQQRVVVGARLRRLDFRIPGTPIVIEADSFAYHSSPMAFEKDRERNNALLARGYRVLHWTWSSLVDQPEVLVRQVREVLARLPARDFVAGSTRPR